MIEMMYHSSRQLAIMREASERIYDPATIDARLAGLSAPERTLLWKLYRASRGRLTQNEARLKAQLLDLYQGTAKEIQGDISRSFEQLRIDNWDLATMRRLGRDQQLFAQINDRIRGLGGATRDTVANGLLGHFRKTYADAAYRLDVMTPDSINIRFGLLPDYEIAAMLAQPWRGADYSTRLGVITDEMASNITHTLVRSMMAEESWQQAARRIRGEMGTSGQRSVWRAEMIARTEIARAQELATASFNADNADVIADEVFVATPYACPEICIPKHGLSVSDVGRPPLSTHPNCACSVFAVPRSWGELAKTGDGDFSIHPPSRATWMRDNMPQMGRE